MKKTDTFKKLLFVTLVGASAVADAQVKAINRPSAGYHFGSYVGRRLQVVAPTPVIGDKIHTIANDGSGGTGQWGAAVTTPILNKKIIMPVKVAGSQDSLVPGSLPVGSMAGHVAMVYRGGGIEFGYKAKQCFLAGAEAVIIVNNVSGGPVGMAEGSSGAGITVPVFMISKEEGDAMGIQYAINDTPVISITNWSAGHTNDLGFISGGAAGWHAFAVPADQLMSSGNPDAYKAADGAYIGNFGTTTASAVSLESVMKFTPTGGGPSTLHTSSVAIPGGSFPLADSIWAMFDTSAGSNNVYDIAATGTGRFDLEYTIKTTTDDYMGDNKTTMSFYATDSLYSKARYDMGNKRPYFTSYNSTAAGTEFLWGPMYFVNKGGAAVSTIEYSLSKNSAGVLDAGQNNIYLFKWIDGNRGLTTDGIVQNGELELVGLAVKEYDVSSTSGDTSGALLRVNGMNMDTLHGASYAYVALESSTWYYLAVDVPNAYFLGNDRNVSSLPRTFARFYNNTAALEYNNLLLSGTKDDIYTTMDGNNTPIPFTQTSFVQSVDSFNFSQSKLIPSVAMYVNKDTASIPDGPPVSNIGVKNLDHYIGSVTLSPNPASNYLNVALELPKMSPVVTYTIIDGLARFVSKETHNNVTNETATINTSNLASGNYFLIVNANGTAVSRKFTIVK